MSTVMAPGQPVHTSDVGENAVDETPLDELWAVKQRLDLVSARGSGHFGIWLSRRPGPCLGRVTANSLCTNRPRDSKAASDRASQVGT